MTQLQRYVLLDTGPLVAMLDKRDQYHGWVSKELSKIAAPLLTCEPVLTEAAFLLKRAVGRIDPIWNLLDRDFLRVPFTLETHSTELRALTDKYSSRPMSLADACLVRMSELFDQAKVLTLDSDFRVYRRFGRNSIPLIIPKGR